MTLGGGDDTRVRNVARDRTTSQGVGGLGAGGIEGPHVRINGLKLLTAYSAGGITRGHQLLPRSREKWLYTARHGRWILWHWRPRVGYVIRALGNGSVPGRDATYERTLGDEDVGFTKRVAAGEKLPAPQLPQETKVLAKLPMLAAFVADVTYEDGSARTPGYFTMRNRVFTYEVTLYDPDAAQRVAVRDTTIDAVLAAANELLKAPDAPWEPDNYLQSQLPKNRKKK